MTLTLKTINADLAKRAARKRVSNAVMATSIFGPAKRRTGLDKTVKVPTVGSLTLEQWVGKFQRLKKLNADIINPPRKKN